MNFIDRTNSKYVVAAQNEWKRRVQWNNPDFGEEAEEIADRAHELGLPLNLVLKSVKEGSLIDLNESLWSKLKNTDSWRLKTMDRLFTLCAEYKKKNCKAIVHLVETGGSLPAPIILKLQDGRYYLVAGNSRLMVCRVLKEQPRVWVAEFPPK